ncbi:Putative lytic transglycosylase [Candidatus Fokinia cryptica]|uniref:Lytic transglycosylase n=2 Tax=Candidatus Fokinia crypta TaxID=1920990 RepID=A0ABZ0UNX8_9RICK|nr:Putative lytic transglycosylase [Candidatus Fokinia cryptica]
MKIWKISNISFAFLLLTSSFCFYKKGYCAPNADIKFNMLEHRKCIIPAIFYEKKYNISENLLLAITVVESGIYNSEAGMALAWPWTIGIAGESYRFSTKSEAIKFFNSKVNQGISNIDVGCSQINYRYHAHNFENIEQMIEPANNIAYASYLIVQNYKNTSEWLKAVAQFHSLTPIYAKKYTEKILNVLKSFEKKTNIKEFSL